MSGGEVLGTALITWLRNAEDEVKVARKVVKAVAACGHGCVQANWKVYVIAAL